MIVGRLALTATDVVILVALTMTARQLSPVRVLAARTLGPPPLLSAVTVVAVGLRLRSARSLAALPASSASIARAPPSPPVRLPVPMPVSLQVIVCQGDVALTPGSPQLLHSSPQGPPEALSMPVSVVRRGPEFRFPPPVARQAGSVFGSGGKSSKSHSYVVFDWFIRQGWFSPIHGFCRTGASGGSRSR